MLWVLLCRTQSDNELQQPQRKSWDGTGELSCLTGPCLVTWFLPLASRMAELQPQGSHSFSLNTAVVCRDVSGNDGAAACLNSLRTRYQKAFLCSLIIV